MNESTYLWLERVSRKTSQGFRYGFISVTTFQKFLYNGQSMKDERITGFRLTKNRAWWRALTEWRWGALFGIFPDSMWIWCISRCLCSSHYLCRISVSSPEGNQNESEIQKIVTSETMRIGWHVTSLLIASQRCSLLLTASDTIRAFDQPMDRYFSG